MGVDWVEFGHLWCGHKEQYVLESILSLGIEECPTDHILLLSRFWINLEIKKTKY